MNPIYRLPSFPRRPRVLTLRSGAVTALAVLAQPALAADVNLTASNGFGVSSFNSSLAWSDGLAPAAGNAYFVASNYNLRTPADSATDHVFAGDSLTITGANLVYKGGTNVNTITVNNLTLNGSIVNNASNSSSPFILAGSITIAGTGTTTFFANNATITVIAPIGGNSGTLLLQTNNTTGRQVILSGANTYTGNINVTGASGAVLSSTGALAFTIGASGVNNTITGTVPFTFDGTFNLDLTNAGNTVGDQWTLVDAANLAESYGAAFNIAGFTENNGFWTSPSGTYQFNEATGVLSRISSDSDGDGLADSWEMTHFGNLDQGAQDDPDSDYATNLLEYQNTTDPSLASSYPDTDGDGLNDGWELNFFNDSLAEVADGDPDGDHNTNGVEQAANTDPNNAFDYPDTDSDGLNDGWEVFYFDTLAAGDPAADPDGDLFDNQDEMESGTDPEVQVSSPDTDNDLAGDSLPDGWEVKYFRVGSEDLAATIAHQDGSGDPDGDGFSNRTEYVAGTDPTDIDSVPGPYAYWRFEDATSGSVPGDENGGAYTTVVADSSGSGNAMRTWNAQTAPAYQTDVPFPTVPVSGLTNASSLYFDAGTDGSWGDIVWTDVQAPLRSTTFTAWTIEASFKMDPAVTGGNQAILSKDGNPYGGQPPFHLKYLAASGRFEIGLIDGSGAVKYLVGESVIESGKWYSVAATADATTLSLWIKAEGSATYLLDGTLAIDGAFYNSYPAFNDAWAVGRARWNGGETDWFKGWIDEVRISGAVLPVDEFLASGSSSSFEAWAAANIPDVNQRGETDDPDGDGTSNLVEFRLGLNPMSGTSFFASSLSGNTITWPAAAGLQFTVQRSTTLAGWDDVATVTATGSTASWTDPSPPAGKGFYRVVLPD
jgi:hypothetical protein